VRKKDGKDSRKRLGDEGGESVQIGGGKKGTPRGRRKVQGGMDPGSLLGVEESGKEKATS